MQALPHERTHAHTQTSAAGPRRHQAWRSSTAVMLAPHTRTLKADEAYLQHFDAAHLLGHQSLHLVDLLLGFQQ